MSRHLRNRGPVKHLLDATRRAGRFAAPVLALSLLASGAGGLSRFQDPVLIARGGEPSPGDGLMLDVPGDGQGFGNGPFGPILETTLLAPGHSLTGDVAALNADGPPGRLTLRALDIADLETACSPAEAVADATCGSGPGELRPDLRFDILGDFNDNGIADDFAPVLLDATIDDLTDELPLNDGDMDTGDVWIFRFTARLPVTSGNPTMTDRLTFDLRWTLTETPGDEIDDVVIGGNPLPAVPTAAPGGQTDPPAASVAGPGSDVLGEQLGRVEAPGESAPAAPAPAPAKPAGWLPRTGPGALLLQLALGLGLILAGIVNRYAGRGRQPGRI